MPEASEAQTLIDKDDQIPSKYRISSTPQPIPLNMHIVNIGNRRQLYHLSRKKNNKPEYKIRPQKTKIKLVWKNNSESAPLKKVIKQRDRYDQSCFSDLRLKYGRDTTMQTEDINDSLEQDTKQFEENIADFIDLQSLKQQVKEMKQKSKKQNFVNIEIPKHSLSTKRERARRKIFSQTDTRKLSCLPNINSINKKGMSQKRYQYLDLDNDPKLDGWAYSLLPSQLDKKLDITEYTNRSQSRNNQKQKDQKLRLNKINKLLNFE